MTTQMVVGEIMSYRAAHGSSPDHIKTLFKVLNNGDTVKIAAGDHDRRRLGSRATHRQLPALAGDRGLRIAPLLAISGLAFPLNNDALYASLAVTLIGLLGLSPSRW